MWRVSAILGVSPFSDDVLNLSIAQMDFILENYAKDHPNEFTFKRPGKEEPNQVAANVGWHDRLRGAALQEFLQSRVNWAAVRVMQERAKAQSAMGLRGPGVIGDAKRHDQR